MTDSNIKVAHGLPLVRDNKGNVWTYFGVEAHRDYNTNEKKKVLSTFGGNIRDRGHENESVHEGYLRELAEESLNIFGRSNLKHPINEDHVSDTDKTKYYNSRISRFYVTNLDETFDPKNDHFIEDFRKRRYIDGNPAKGSNPRLKGCEKEVSEVRRVKVADLLEYLDNPEKFPEGLVTQGYNGTKKEPLHVRGCSKHWLDFSGVREILDEQHQKMQSRSSVNKPAVVSATKKPTTAKPSHSAKNVTKSTNKKSAPMVHRSNQTKTKKNNKPKSLQEKPVIQKASSAKLNNSETSHSLSQSEILWGFAGLILQNKRLVKDVIKAVNGPISVACKVIRQRNGR